MHLDSTENHKYNAHESSSVYSGHPGIFLFLWGPQKTYISPKNNAKFCANMTFFTSLYRTEKRAPAGHQMLDFNFQGQNALNLFFRPGQWIKITETSLINSSLSNQKGANICLKCTRRVDFPSRPLSAFCLRCWSCPWHGLAGPRWAYRAYVRHYIDSMSPETIMGRMSRHSASAPSPIGVARRRPVELRIDLDDES